MLAQAKSDEEAPELSRMFVISGTIGSSSERNRIGYTKSTLGKIERRANGTRKGERHPGLAVGIRQNEEQDYLPEQKRQKVEKGKFSEAVVGDTKPDAYKLSDANIIKPERKLVVPKRRKLIVLDVNGLLVDIISDMHKRHKGGMRIGCKSVFKRPFCDDFIKFCFEKFDIGIWSSRKRNNVEDVVEYLMSEISHELLFCWGQDQCTFTGFYTLENADKPLVLKELKKLWNKEEKGLPWKKGYFSPSNTLLIDDSPYKALCNPPHTAIFPHPYRFDNENDNSLGPGGDLRVYLEGLYEAEDVHLYVQQHPFGQQAITSDNPSWNFYSQVVGKIEKKMHGSCLE